MFASRMLSPCISVLLVLSFVACGKSPTSPSNNTGNNSNNSGNNSGNNNAACGGVAVGPTGCAKGMITGTINGATFNGGVPTGSSVYTPIAAQPALGLPAQDFFVIGGVSSDFTTLTITARAKVGTAPLGANVIDPETKNVSILSAHLSTVANGVASGAWNTNVTAGTGTITVNSVSTTAASGSFSLTMVAQPGTGASGNKTVTGTFNVTF